VDEQRISDSYAGSRAEPDFRTVISSDYSMTFIFAAMLVASSTPAWELRTAHLLVTPFLVATIALTLTVLRRDRRPPVIPIAVALIAVFALASLSWAQLPISAIRDVLGLVCCLIAGIAFANLVNVNVVVKGVILASLTLIGMSAIRVFVDPTGAFPEQVLNGPYIVRSPLTYVLGLGLVASVFSTFRSKWIWAAVVVIQALALALTHGSTGILAVSVSVVVAFWLRSVVRTSGRRRHLLVALPGVALVALAGVLYFYSVVIVHVLFGKDLTLSGRTVIWRFVWHNIREHPWVGSGWGNENVWSLSGTTGLRVAQDWATFRGLAAPQQLAHAHNAFLEIALYLGITGAILLGLTLASSALYASSLQATGAPTENRNWTATLGLIIYLGIYSLTEPYLIQAIGLILFSSIMVLQSRKFGQSPPLTLSVRIAGFLVAPLGGSVVTSKRTGKGRRVR
jgi:exopolysaccharide production protein ExoQ